MAVAVPRAPADVSTLVRWAAAEGAALIPRGAGTGMPGGNVGPWMVVSFTGGGAPEPVDGLGLAWLEPVDVEARTVRVGAGVVAQRVQAAAAAADLDFPPLPSSAAWATIGGMVSAGAAGARSFGLGAVGDWVEALEVVLADGSIREIRRGDPASAILGDGPTRRLNAEATSLLPSWPDVRKNASGYRLNHYLATGDLLDLFVASEGTLGLLTSVVLRLRPPPTLRMLTVAGAAAMDEVEEWAELSRTLGASACEFIGPWLVERAGLHGDEQVGHLIPPGGSLVLMELEGESDEVHAGLARLEAASRSLSPGGLVQGPSEGSELWGLRKRASPIIEEAAGAGLRSMQFIEDSVVPPGRLSAYAAGLARILEGEDTEAALFGHAGDANVHVNPLIDVGRPDWKGRVRRILEQTATLVSELGGTLTGEHGDGRVRAPFLEQVWGTETVRVFESLKDTLDPEGLFNPGVIIPLANQDPLEAISAEAPLDPHAIESGPLG